MDATSTSLHQVLARKYRPTRLSDLIGQDVLVQILKQGLASNRLPHAFLFHGTRGVGKTTTARILAKALNCIGSDGKGTPTPDPCGACEHCVGISLDRHMDVIEIDAASKTGVDDIREIIDSSRYKALSARYKIYIIDEVHMLSKSAFNALLKTLEEPPAHVKFVFATTELRKIPETILSRCMRFDLNRIPATILLDHIKNITTLENKTIEDEAAALIARSANGSCRDSLSLLDQAIALCGDIITAAQVRDMLGVADRHKVFNLLQFCMQGDAQQGLNLFHEMFKQGADPVALIEDLMGIIHWISCLKTSPELVKDMSWPQIDRELGAQLANKFHIPQLLHAWQILNTGHVDLQTSIDPQKAVDIILLRLCYVGSLPPLEQIIDSLSQQTSGSSQSAGNRLSSAPTTGSIRSQSYEPQTDHTISKPVLQNPEVIQLTTFADIVQLSLAQKKMMLYTNLTQDVKCINFDQAGHETILTLEMLPTAPDNLQKELVQWLEGYTNLKWSLKISKSEQHHSIFQQQLNHLEAQKIKALEHPTVKTLLRFMPNAQTDFIPNHH